MAEPTTTTTRRCPKHAFAPHAQFRPGNDVTANVICPGHRRVSGPCRTELTSGSPVAADDPVNETDPSGKWTVGACAGGAAAVLVGFGGGVMGSLCAFKEQTGFFGNVTGLAVSETGGLGGVGVDIGGNLELGFQVSTAANPHDLAGDDDQVTVTVSGTIYGGSIDVFWGHDSAGQLVVGANIGWAPGLEAGVSYWQTATKVQELHPSTLSGFALAAAFDLISWPSQSEQDQAINVARQTYAQYQSEGSPGNASCTIA